MKGVVKKFNKDKGYGFIKLDDNRDIFFHYSELVMDGFKNIEDGANVEFELVNTERGEQAKHVVKVD